MRGCSHVLSRSGIVMPRREGRWGVCQAVLHRRRAPDFCLICPRLVRGLPPLAHASPPISRDCSVGRRDLPQRAVNATVRLRRCVLWLAQMPPPARRICLRRPLGLRCLVSSFSNGIAGSTFANSIYLEPCQGYRILEGCPTAFGGRRELVHSELSIVGGGLGAGAAGWGRPSIVLQLSENIVSVTHLTRISSFGLPLALSRFGLLRRSRKMEHGGFRQLVKSHCGDSREPCRPRGVQPARRCDLRPSPSEGGRLGAAQSWSPHSVRLPVRWMGSEGVFEMLTDMWGPCRGQARKGSARVFARARRRQSAGGARRLL